MRRFMAVICAAALAAASTVAGAQEGRRDEVRRDRGPLPAAQHWIGAMCAPADAALCAQLNVKSGLVVLSVVPDSPADEAGLKQHDVLTAIGDRDLEQVADLVEAVNADDGHELKLSYYRAGKADETTVKPAERPTADVLRRFIVRDDEGRPLPPPDADRLREMAEKLRQNMPEGEARRMQDWLERMQRGEAPPMRMLAFGPGVVMQHVGGGPLPQGVKVQVTKNGDQPAEIHVERGDERWDVRENELDKLPEDLRGPIGAMIGGGPHGAMMITPHGAASAVAIGSGEPGVRIKIDGVEGAVQPFTIPLPPGAVPAEFEALKKQVEQLQRDVEALRKELSASPDKEPAAKKPARPKT